MMRAILGLALLLAAPALAGKPAAKPVDMIDDKDVFACTTPIAARTTAASVLSHWPQDAHRDTLQTADGPPMPSVTLFGKSSADGLAITWWDKKQTAVAGVRSVSPRWHAGGLHVGSTLAEVQAANGKPFVISGFGWDYGGFVTDSKGGKLDKLAGGACRLQLRFGSPKPAPDSLSGDGRILSSDDPKLIIYGPVVTEIALGWPLPKGVEAANQGPED